MNFIRSHFEKMQLWIVEDLPYLVYNFSNSLKAAIRLTLFQLGKDTFCHVTKPSENRVKSCNSLGVSLS